MGHLMTIWKQKNTFAVIMYIHYAKWTLNFERIFVTDFCSNNSDEISLVYLLYQQKSIPEFPAIFFTRHDFV